MWIKLNDSFTGESKGKTKNIDDWAANELIALGHAEAVDAPVEVKEDKPAAGRQTKEDKNAK